MSRAPDGTLPQPQTDAALFAHIAYRLEGILVAELRDYATNTLKIKVGDNAIRKADATADRIQDLPSSPLRSWVLVDFDALNFFSALVRLRGTGRNAMGEIGRIAGVVQVMRLATDSELIALVIYERRNDQLRLEAQLAERAEIVSWEQIEAQTHEPSISTWRSFAHQAAAIEDLL